jgi:hypothetical protein
VSVHGTLRKDLSKKFRCGNSEGNTICETVGYPDIRYDEFAQACRPREQKVSALWIPKSDGQIGSRR